MKSSDEIEMRVRTISECVLFVSAPPQLDGSPPDAKSFFDHLETHRSDTMCQLARRYRAIGPILTKLEGTVFRTSTGKLCRFLLVPVLVPVCMSEVVVYIVPFIPELTCLSIPMHLGCSPKMGHYYSHWERNIFSAVLSMVCSNLTELYCAMERETGQPLFSVDSILSVPEIVIHPPGPELYKMYTNTVCSPVNSSNLYC